MHHLHHKKKQREKATSMEEIHKSSLVQPPVKKHPISSDNSRKTPISPPPAPPSALPQLSRTQQPTDQIPPALPSLNHIPKIPHHALDHFLLPFAPFSFPPTST
jgi:hypothetical protein